MEMTRKEARKAAAKVNDVLSDLSRRYHASLPIADIDNALTANGFEPTEPAIYCGRDGQCKPMPVGSNMYLAFSWHKMEGSGRYEVTTYLS